MIIEQKSEVRPSEEEKVSALVKEITNSLSKERTKANVASPGNRTLQTKNHSVGKLKVPWIDDRTPKTPPPPARLELT